MKHCIRETNPFPTLWVQLKLRNRLLNFNVLIFIIKNMSRYLSIILILNLLSMILYGWTLNSYQCIKKILSWFGLICRERQKLHYISFCSTFFLFMYHFILFSLNFVKTIILFYILFFKIRDGQNSNRFLFVSLAISKTQIQASVATNLMLLPIGPAATNLMLLPIRPWGGHLFI